MFYRSKYYCAIRKLAEIKNKSFLQVLSQFFFQDALGEKEKLTYNQFEVSDGWSISILSDSVDQLRMSNHLLP
ncbi:hypothetical protein RIR_jg41875.t1 [Rhizophagus irregularis DAOM 181602=DAOM 197198]|nr:hypothetical protein RIR_jg41875.t1 [Rhizophagus irregularis DAOM 181602=DAOM 197198]